MTDRRAVAILALVSIALYARSAGFGFVRADDTDLVEENAAFLSSLSNIPRAFTQSFFEGGNVLTDLKTYYRPVAVVSFIVETTIAGSRPAMYHFTNVLLHAFVVALLFLVLRHLTFVAQPFRPFRAAMPGAGRAPTPTRWETRVGGPGPEGPPYEAFLVSLVFAVHPANAQTVCWIMGRNELLLAAFSLLALSSILSYLRNDRTSWLVIHAFTFAGAVFSKETGIVLLPLFGVWGLPFGGPDRVRPTLSLSVVAPGFRLRAKRASARLAVALAEAVSRARRLMPVLSLDVAFALVWWWLRSRALAGGAPEQFTWRALAVNAPQLFSYFEKIVFPFRLNTMPGVDRVGIALGATAAIVIAVSLVRALGTRRSCFIASWCLAFLLPALFVPGLPAYEHRLYVPMIGLALAFGCWDQGSGIRERESPTLRTRARTLKPDAQSRLAALTVAAVFFVISFRYSETFRTPLSYWTRATEGTPFAPIAHVNVGQILQEAGQPQKAAAHFRRALEIDPNVPKAHNNLGVALMQLGHPREGLEAFNREAELHPRNADAHFNLGLYFSHEGNSGDAISQWEETLRLNKYYLPAYEKLVEAHAARGERERSAWYEQRLRELQGR